MKITPHSSHTWAHSRDMSAGIFRICFFAHFRLSRSFITYISSYNSLVIKSEYWKESMIIRLCKSLICEGSLRVWFLLSSLATVDLLIFVDCHSNFGLEIKVREKKIATRTPSPHRDSDSVGIWYFTVVGISICLMVWRGEKTLWRLLLSDPGERADI